MIIQDTRPLQEKCDLYLIAWMKIFFLYTRSLHAKCLIFIRLDKSLGLAPSRQGALLISLLPGQGRKPCHHWPVQVAAETRWVSSQPAMWLAVLAVASYPYIRIRFSTLLV